MRNFLNALKRDEDGASLVEYAMLVALVAVAAVGAVTGFGTALAGFFGGLAAKLGLG